MVSKDVCVVISAVLLGFCSAAPYAFIPGLEYDGKIYIPLEAVSPLRIVRGADPRHHHGQGETNSQAFANSEAQAGAGGNFGGGGVASAKSDASAGAGDFVFPGGQGFGGEPGKPSFQHPGLPFPFKGQPGFPGEGPGGNQGGFGRPHGDVGQASADAKSTADSTAGGSPYQPAVPSQIGAFPGKQPGSGSNGFGFVPAPTSQGGASAGASGGSAADANAQTQTFTGNGFTATSSSASSSSRTQGFGGLSGGANSVATANAAAKK